MDRFHDLVFGPHGEDLWKLLLQRDFKDVEFTVCKDSSPYQKYVRNHLVQSMANPSWHSIEAENGDYTAVERQVMGAYATKDANP